MRRLISFFLPLLLSVNAAPASDVGKVEAFHDAVAQGQIATVAEMLKADPKLATSVGEFGFQPMNLQDLYFEPEIFRMLLAAGADVNAANDDGITLLHIIADPEPVAQIVAAGGNLEARDRDGRTPLMIAMTEAEREDVIEALIAAGADVNAKDNKGETALSISRLRDEDGVREMLIEAGARE